MNETDYSDIKSTVTIIDVIKLVEVIKDRTGIPIRQIISYWTKEGEMLSRTDSTMPQDGGGYVEIGNNGEVSCRY